MFSFDAVYWIAVLAVVMQAIIAMTEGMFLPSQMRDRGFTNGFSFVQHCGMWGDFLILPFAISLMWRYHDKWSTMATALALAAGLLITLGMHFSWVKGATSQEHILSNKGLTQAGWAHVIYMWAVLVMIMLFYFGGEGSPQDEMWIACLLAAHVALGTIGVSLMKSGRVDFGSVATTGVAWAALAVAVIW